MEQYLSVVDTAEKWELTARRVQTLCNENRIDGAIKQSGVWLIPSSAKKPIRIAPGKKKTTEKKLNVLSLFSGCGGMDLGIEGGFSVLKKAVNTDIHPNWDIKSIDENWVKLGKTRFQTVFANDIKESARAAWTNYFGERGTDTSVYCLDSIVDLVKLEKENHISVFPKNIDVVTGGFPCQDFSVAGKR